MGATIQNFPDLAHLSGQIGLNEKSFILNADYTVKKEDCFLNITDGAGSVVNLPACSSCPGRILLIKGNSFSAGIQIVSNGADTIELNVNPLLINPTSTGLLLLISDGASDWGMLASKNWGF